MISWCDFTSFSIQVISNLHNFRFRVPEIHIQNLSNCCRRKYDPLISWIFQILFLAAFCNLAQLCTTVVVIIIHAAFHRWTVEVKRKAVPFLLYYILLFPSLLNDSSKVELRCDKVVSWFFKFHRNFIECCSKKESSRLASLLLFPSAMKWQ